MANGKEHKFNQSFSCPDYLLDLLDAHLSKLNKNSFTKTDRSTWICKAIRTQMILEKSESPEFWESIVKEEQEIILSDSSE